MIYKLDSTPYSLYPWKKIFASFSIQQFGQIYNRLAFPFAPSDNLRQLAHAFVLADAVMRRNPDNETALNAILNDSNIAKISNKLVENVAPDTPLLAMQEILFANMFAHLEKMGYAELIYRWGRET